MRMNNFNHEDISIINYDDSDNNNNNNDWCHLNNYLWWCVWITLIMMSSQIINCVDSDNDNDNDNDNA